MQALRQKAVVGADGLIEIHSPGSVRPGTVAEVVVLFEEPVEPLPHQSLPSLASFWGKGKGLFKTPEDATAFIRRERDKWES